MGHTVRDVVSYARREKTRSLIAQLVEQSTVNRSVAGSSPAQGATSLTS